MRTICLTILLLFWFLAASSHDYVFENISTVDGLSQNDIHCIIQDSQGFLWFATYDGVNRYDGYTFNSYHFDIEKNEGLNSNLILTMAEDPFQNIWVGTADRGLNIIRHTDDQIIDVAVPNSENNLLALENIVHIDFVNNIALVFTKEEIFFLRITKDSYEPLKINDQYFVKTGAFATKCFYRISESEFLLGTSNGLKVVHVNTQSGIDIEIKTYKRRININSIVPFRKGYLLACAGNMYYVDENFKFDLFQYENYLELLIEDKNHIWAANEKGLHYLAFKNHNSPKFTVERSYSKSNTNNQLSSNIVRTIYRDKLGIIWLGTSGGGVTKMINRGNKFKLYNNEFKSRNLQNNNINCIFEDTEENLWIGTNNGGITYFDKGISNYNKKGEELAIKTDRSKSIYSFHQLNYQNQEIVISTTSYPLNISVHSTKGEPLNKLRISSQLKRITHPVNVMASDNRFLWLGTHEGGLYRFNLKTNKLEKYLQNQWSQLKSNLIRSLYFDTQNRLWIGTDKGLHMLTAKQQEKESLHFTVFENNPSDTTSISYNYVLPIIETKDNTIWIGTLGGGLNRFNEKDQTFQHFTTQHGLPNNNVKGILEDDKNRLWISTNKGISCFSPKTNQFLNFSIADGLQDYEFKDLLCTKRKNGEMIFAGNNGINTFFPENIKIDSTMPNIVFTNLQISGTIKNANRSITRGQLSDYCNANTKLQLKYHQNSFTAYFTALHFLAPQKIKYKYRLNGFEENWNEISSQSRFAKYTNLNPGEYQLQVLATNSDGIWATTPLTLNFKISKPWYGTYLAYFVYALAFLIIFWFFNRYSLIRNKIKHDLLMERFEKEKEKELTQTKLRFFTNISHEFRTPLTVIKSYIENVSTNWQNTPKEKINSDFSIINKNVDSLLRLVTQLLDFRKLDQEKMTISPTNKNIVEMLEKTSASFKMLAEKKQINLLFEPNIEHLELWFDEDKMEKILNNLLSNAIKNTSKGSIRIQLTELINEVKIEIIDTGIGIPNNMQAHIFDRFFQVENKSSNYSESTGVGLSLTKGLVELHNGRIELESQEGIGSNFVLFFKKGNEHFNSLTTKQESQPPTPALTEKDEINTSKRHTEKRVLIVEDNLDLCAFLNEKLQSYFKVETANNGQEGLEKCLALTPDLVVSDVMMPIMNGYQLCESIKNNEHISHIPVVLLTAKTSDEAQLQGFTIGADAYVSKPFNFDILVARMTSILDSREKIWNKLKENPFLKPSEISLTQRDEEFLIKIETIIEAHISNPKFTVEQLAEQYGITKINLNKKIKALSGKTTIQYIRLQRLKRAAELLKSPHNRVSDVTYDVGFTDLQYFRDQFKKEFKISPSEFKKQNTKPSSN